MLDLGEQPLAERDNGERYPLRLVRCGNCDLVQLSHIVDQKEVFPPEHPYQTGMTGALRKHFAELAQKLSEQMRPGDLTVDIACNDGTLLGMYRAGFRRAGVEPTMQAQKCAARGIPTWQCFFTAEVGRDIRQQHGPAATVTSCNVLAHVPDLSDFMEGVLALLDEDGIFVVETHDWASIVNGLQWDAAYQEHLRYFSIASLSYLLARHGLLVREVERIPTHGGSFRAFAVREQPHLSERAGYAALALNNLLEAVASEGPVYGIGATTRATPLIHYAKIGPYLTCVCEVAGSEKIGQVIPGTGILVVDEAKLIADQPPWALLLAHHLVDSIVPSLRAKGYHGKFILPLPKAVILND